MAGRGGRTGGTRPKGNGAGYGGQAKGGGDRPAQPFAANNSGGPGRIETPKSVARAERIEKLKEQLEHLAFNAESEAVRVTAADKLLDRLEGKPAQTQINASLDDIAKLTDDQLSQLLAAAERLDGAEAGGEAAPRNAAPKGGKPH